MSATMIAGIPVADMTGPQKAAVLLLSLGNDKAVEMLRRLPEADANAIIEEIASIDNVDATVVDNVIADFAATADGSRGLTTGGEAVARRLLAATVGSERMDELVESKPSVVGRRAFEFLFALDPRLSASFLKDEDVRTIALVLANLPADLAAALLREFPAEFRTDVAVRIAVLDKTSPEVVSLIEDHLAERFASIAVDDQRVVGGVTALVDLLNRADGDTERAVVDGLREVDVDLAERVRAAMFSFDDLVSLGDRDVQQILRSVDSKDLAIALKGATSAVQQKILGNLSTRAADTLREEVELLGRVRISAVDEARATVLRVVRDMEEQGQLVLERANDDFVD